MWFILSFAADAGTRAYATIKIINIVKTLHISVSAFMFTNPVREANAIGNMAHKMLIGKNHNATTAIKLTPQGETNCTKSSLKSFFTSDRSETIMIFMAIINTMLQHIQCKSGIKKHPATALKALKQLKILNNLFFVDFFVFIHNYDFELIITHL